MDANGQNFCLLSSKHHWQLLEQPSGLAWDADRQSLRLARLRRDITFVDDELLAQQRLLITPQTLDRYGNRAAFDPLENAIVSHSELLDNHLIFAAAPDGEEPAPMMDISDLVMADDDVLYIAVDGNIVMHDRRDRWAERNLTIPAPPAFSAWRLAADPRGGVWVLDRTNKKLARVSGLPLHKLAVKNSASEQPGACVDNPNPPTLTVLDDISWRDAETPVAIACNASGQLAILCWAEDADARVYLLDQPSQLSQPMLLSGARNPYSMKWIRQDRIALLLAGINNEAPVYLLDAHQLFAGSSEDAALPNSPMGDLYPLKPDFSGGPFLQGANLVAGSSVVHYPSAIGSRALHRLSFPFYTHSGQAINHPQQALLDSGNDHQVWHRLYLEGIIPDGCGIKIWLAASDERLDFADILPEQWYEHRFGKRYQQTTRADIPVASYENIASELPHHPGLLPCELQAGTSGLFNVLIQRSTRRVRSLTGRYLHLQVEFTGQGRDTPEVFAIRAYGSRFSWVNEYLPQLYQETVFEPEADENGDATQADFLNRFVANFEGVLTNIEDRIAQAQLLTDPLTVPAESLSWLGSWIGHEVNDSLSEAVQRELLQAAPELYRWHGSLRGLKLALEIVTGGAISGGDIVVLEDFRLRRSFVTIIGADLVDEDDPLFAGGGVSGNSYIGDTLFVGDENRREFLALFNADLDVSLREQTAIDALFDRLAHRVTILVHEAVEAQDLGLIRHIVAQEVPAHVQTRILSASHRFIVGMSSLVGVDSYLANRLSPRKVRIGRSQLGKRDFIIGPAALDARLQPQTYQSPPDELRPLATAEDVNAEFGNSVTLDGSASRAFGERQLTQFNWQYKGKGDLND